MPTDFAAALANPIAYQSQLEKHARQLAILEDFDSEVRKRKPIIVIFVVKRNRTFEN